jgi:hypothetical protein
LSRLQTLFAGQETKKNEKTYAFYKAQKTLNQKYYLGCSIYYILFDAFYDQQSLAILSYVNKNKSCIIQNNF